MRKNSVANPKSACGMCYLCDKGRQCRTPLISDSMSTHANRNPRKMEKKVIRETVTTYSGEEEYEF